MKPSQELTTAVESYFRFRAAVETLEPIMNDITLAVMAEFHPQYDAKWCERPSPRQQWVGEITDPKHLYMLAEGQWDAFFALLDFAKKEAGFTGLPDGQCPLLVCKSRQCDAENAMIAEAAKAPGCASLAKGYISPENRAKLIDITLRWVTQYISKKRMNGIALPFSYKPTTIAARCFA